MLYRQQKTQPKQYIQSAGSSQLVNRVLPFCFSCFFSSVFIGRLQTNFNDTYCTLLYVSVQMLPLSVKASWLYIIDSFYLL